MATKDVTKLQIIQQIEAMKKEVARKERKLKRLERAANVRHFIQHHKLVENASRQPEGLSSSSVTALPNDYLQKTACHNDIVRGSNHISKWVQFSATPSDIAGNNSKSHLHPLGVNDNPSKNQKRENPVLTVKPHMDSHNRNNRETIDSGVSFKTHAPGEPKYEREISANHKSDLPHPVFFGSTNCGTNDKTKGREMKLSETVFSPPTENHDSHSKDSFGVKGNSILPAYSVERSTVSVMETCLANVPVQATKKEKSSISSANHLEGCSQVSQVDRNEMAGNSLQPKQSNVIKSSSGLEGVQANQCHNLETEEMAKTSRENRYALRSALRDSDESPVSDQDGTCNNKISSLAKEVTDLRAALQKCLAWIKMQSAASFVLPDSQFANLKLELLKGRSLSSPATEKTSVPQELLLKSEGDTPRHQEWGMAEHSLDSTCVNLVHCTTSHTSIKNEQQPPICPKNKSSLLVGKQSNGCRLHDVSDTQITESEVKYTPPPLLRIECAKNHTLSQEQRACQGSAAVETCRDHQQLTFTQCIRDGTEDPVEKLQFGKSADGKSELLIILKRTIIQFWARSGNSSWFQSSSYPLPSRAKVEDWCFLNNRKSCQVVLLLSSIGMVVLMQLQYLWNTVCLNKAVLCLNARSTVCQTPLLCGLHPTGCVTSIWKDSECILQKHSFKPNRSTTIGKSTEVMTSMTTVAELHEALLGMGSNYIYVWNHVHCSLSKVIDLKSDIGHMDKCLWASGKNGLLFLVCQKGARQGYLHVVNPTTGVQDILLTYDCQEEAFDAKDSSHLLWVTDHHLYAVQKGRELIIWNLLSAKPIAHFRESQLSAGQLCFNRSPMLFVGLENGCVHMYRCEVCP